MFNFSGVVPDFLSTNDLVKLGLYPNKNSAYFARLKGLSPDYIRLGRKILYPQKSVIEFIDCHTTKGKVVSNAQNNTDNFQQEK